MAHQLQRQLRDRLTFSEIGHNMTYGFAPFNRVFGTLVAVLPLLVTGCGEPSLENSSGFVEREGIGGIKGLARGKEDGHCPDFPPYYFEFLDDTSCRKRSPSNRDRDLACPNVATSTFGPTDDNGESAVYHPESPTPIVDNDALVGIVPDDLKITLILVRRIDGVPHYRYLSNGSHADVFQPWSSTKFMAIANAGSTLRQASDGNVGLTATVNDQPVGDLITMVHNYDERSYTSNGLSRWFLDIGGRNQLDQYLHGGWLQRPATETVGGNYGHPSSKVGTEFVDDAGSLFLDDTATWAPANQLSTFTIAEFLKRLVMHRESPEFAMPGLTWSDVQTLLYGAEVSQQYGSHEPQGMESDTAVYLQQALDIRALEAKSRGQWRIFSKLGFGYDRGGEFVNAGYACLPVLDEVGEPVPDWGKEFFVVTQLGAAERYRATDARLAEIYRTIVNGVMDGSIGN